MTGERLHDFSGSVSTDSCCGVLATTKMRLRQKANMFRLAEAAC